MARRRAATRDRIVDVAARRFAAAGIDAVSLDQIAEEADVARGTLYSHFESKGELVSAVVEPVLRMAVDEISAVSRLDSRDGLERLLRIYLALWRRNAAALRIADKAQDAPVGNVGTLHRSFLRGVLRVFEQAHQAGILRCQSPELAGHIVRRVAVPLLELYAEHPDGERLFVESVKGLLLRDSAERTRASRQPRA